MKDTVMKMKHNVLNKIILCSALAITFAFASGCASSSGSSDSAKPMTDSEMKAMPNRG